jgi:adenosine deaminase
MNALTLHICACGPIETWQVFTRYEPEDLTVHTNVLVCTVTLKLAQSIDAIPTMLAGVGRTFININITPVSKKNPHYIYLSIITTVF